MAKTEVEEVTNKALRSGGILTKLYFDMQSEKPDDLQPLMVDLINNRLLKTPGVIYCVGAIDEPIKMKDTYSTNCIATLLAKDMWSLMNLVFLYAPAGIEILKPTGDYSLKPAEIQTILVNLSQVSTEYSQYILGKVLSKEDFEKIKQNVKQREELGKKLIEKKSGDESAGEPS